MEKNNTAIKLFEHKQVRSAWNEEKKVVFFCNRYNKNPDTNRPPKKILERFKSQNQKGR